MIDIEPKAAGSTPQPEVYEAEPHFHSAAGRGLVIEKRQVITPDLLRQTHEARLKTEAEDEFMHVAAVPTAVVEHWARQGFDILRDKNIKAKDIAKRLKAEGLDQFLCTSKKV